VFQGTALALTAQEIVDSVVDNLDNVSDYEASCDIDYDDAGVSDSTDNAFQWKRSGSVFMSKTVLGSPYNGEIRTDGTTGYNIWDIDDYLSYATIANGDAWVREAFGTDLLNMEKILSEESWTKDGNTYSVNSVQCYRLYNSSYEVWIDVSTVTKVIRTKAYDGGAKLDYQVDYSDYSYYSGHIIDCILGSVRV
jgi:hypothetical protein